MGNIKKTVRFTSNLYSPQYWNIQKYQHMTILRDIGDFVFGVWEGCWDGVWEKANLWNWTAEHAVQDDNIQMIFSRPDFIIYFKTFHFQTI